MSFKDDIPHYKSMQDNDYYNNSLPNWFWYELPQFILGYCNEDEEGCGEWEKLEVKFLFLL